MTKCITCSQKLTLIAVGAALALYTLPQHVSFFINCILIHIKLYLFSYVSLLPKFSFNVTPGKISFYKGKQEVSVQYPCKLHNIFSSLLNPLPLHCPFFLTAPDFATLCDEKRWVKYTSLDSDSSSYIKHAGPPSSFSDNFLLY